ncbi:MAG: cell division protein FtsZ [Bacteroidaceae bacterium]|nr:cell division protein FtsZ [Bacteroidaceae bacterium]
MNNELTNDIPLDFNLPKDKTENIIKVIGVGGGGGNAVTNMYKQGICNVAFAVCNTDSQALAKCEVPLRVQLGESGLGTGGQPEKGKQEAEGAIDKIEKLFDDDTKMVFITAGMGGGTGTGASPVIAHVAKQRGILTIGIVTIPFRFEGKLRIKKALHGVEEMRKNVDALLVINNERLIDLYKDEMLDAVSALSKADEVLTVSTKSIAEIITIKGIINRDFQDVQTVMKDGGTSLISVGEASGEHRIQKAFIKALESPLLSNMHVDKAEKLLYIIYSCEENPVGIRELGEINELMEEFTQDVLVLWGLYRDNSLGDNVKVALIASGLDDKPQVATPVEDVDFVRQMESYYGVKRQEPVAATPQQKEERAEEEVCVAEEPSDDVETLQTVGNSLFTKIKNELEKFVEKLAEE